MAGGPPHRSRGVQVGVSLERQVGTRSQRVSALLRSCAKQLEPVKGL